VSLPQAAAGFRAALVIKIGIQKKKELKVTSDIEGVLECLFKFSSKI
jgi:hypothetical protein